MNYSDFYKELSEKYNTDSECEIVSEKSTAALCTFRIGSVCREAVYPKNTAVFTDVINTAEKNGEKYIVIGNGSNIVFPDEKYDGVVICTSKMNCIEVCGDHIAAQCGATLNAVCQAALSAELSGLEFAYGIPGSVGGGIFMNAGAYGGELSDVTESVTVYDRSRREIFEVPCDKCGFTYRHSAFQDSDMIILSARFVLKKGEKDDIKARMTDILSKRHEKQPLNYPSAGSVFKRYPGRYTGQMIDEAGLKGMTVGGAQISELHAGFIVNIGNATCKELKELIEIIKREIKKREGIDIECEIRFIE